MLFNMSANFVALVPIRCLNKDGAENYMCEPVLNMHRKDVLAASGAFYVLIGDDKGVLHAYVTLFK